MWQNFPFLRILKLKYNFKENNLRLLCFEMQHIVEVLNTLATAFKHTSHLFHLWELPIVLHNGVKTFWCCTRICFHCFNVARNFLFLEVDHPLCNVWKQKFQILIAHQKEGIDQTQKSMAGRHKKFEEGLEDFVRVFFAVDHPLCDVWKQKNSNFYCS